MTKSGSEAANANGEQDALRSPLEADATVPMPHPASLDGSISTVDHDEKNANALAAPLPEPTPAAATAGAEIVPATPAIAPVPLSDGAGKTTAAALDMPSVPPSPAILSTPSVAPQTVAPQTVAPQTVAPQTVAPQTVVPGLQNPPILDAKAPSVEISSPPTVDSTVPVLAPVAPVVGAPTAPLSAQPMSEISASSVATAAPELAPPSFETSLETSMEPPLEPLSGASISVPEAPSAGMSTSTIDGLPADISAKEIVSEAITLPSVQDSPDATSTDATSTGAISTDATQNEAAAPQLPEEKIEAEAEAEAEAAPPEPSGETEGSAETSKALLQKEFDLSMPSDEKSALEGFQDLESDLTRETDVLPKFTPESPATLEGSLETTIGAKDAASEPSAPTGEVTTAQATPNDPSATSDEVKEPPLPNAEGFAPPNLPGVRNETTRPLRSPFFSQEEDAPEETKVGDFASGTSSHTREMSRPTSSISTDESRTAEGAPFTQEALGPAQPPPAESILTSTKNEKVMLTAPLGDQGGSTFYRATVEGESQAYTAVWTPEVLFEPPWDHLPDPRIVRPRARVELEGATLRVFERPKGNTVVDYLLDPNRFLPAMATLELGIELAEILESLHGSGLYLYDLDPSQVVIEKGGRVRLYPIGGFFRAGELPRGAAGPFAAPEVRRGYRFRFGAHSDVYSVALVLWSLLARRSPLNLDFDPELLVNPRTFRQECPLGIWPYLQIALLASTKERLGYARGFRLLLERARNRLLTEARVAEDRESIVLEAWPELHCGLSKARRGSDQQDRAVCVTDEGGGVGLYLIADGVSRSRFGDGAFAAEQVKQAAVQRWNALEKAGPAALSLSHPQRQDVLRQISHSAGKRISAEVNARYTPMPNEPNQVMSTTLVAAFVVNGEASVANLGDSRCYLIREGTIEQITIDHDRTTDGQRMGLSFAEASRMRMGAALTRVVGRVQIQQDGQVRPDPFEPEVFRLRLLPGDRLLICSDGLADFAAGAGAPARDAERAMREALDEFEDPVRASFELVVLANRAGGYDNISCVVVAAHRG
ncbi:MAG: SpoIIE family protein phosphatase [Deltaproteobacteria bacterium]|nr:SpoIIE family protein phosphatase [Deltaproteobacteria bacterium]